jgi:hypothetical protein
MKSQRRGKCLKQETSQNGDYTDNTAENEVHVFSFCVWFIWKCISDYLFTNYWFRCYYYSRTIFTRYTNRKSIKHWTLEGVERTKRWGNFDYFGIQWIVSDAWSGAAKQEFARKKLHFLIYIDSYIILCDLYENM